MSKTKPMDRIASWSRDTDGLVTFRYTCNGTPYVFFVMQQTLRARLREIGELAANPAVDFDHMDAEYLTSLIREVMAMQPEAHDLPCCCDRCLGTARDNFMWQLMMFVCSAALMATLAVFVLWGAR